MKAEGSYFRANNRIPEARPAVLLVSAREPEKESQSKKE